MNLIKLVRSTDWKLNVIALISIVSIVVHDLYLAGLPELFSGGDELINSLYNVLMGYFVSYIFFILVVQYREYRDKQFVSAIVKPSLESMVVNHVEMNKALSIALDYPKFNGLCPEITTHLFKKVGGSEEIPNIPETYVFRRCSWMMYLDYQRKSMLRKLDTLYPYIPHLEPELVELLNRYKDCRLYLALDFLLQGDESGNDLSVIGSYYSEYSQIGKMLFEYVKKLP